MEMRDLQREQHVFRCIIDIRTVFAASVPVICRLALLSSGLPAVLTDASVYES